MKHTPGPWEQMPSGVMGSLSVWNPQRALVVAMAGGMSAEEGLSNARLIAAAPELLEALQEFVRVLNSGTPVNLIQEIGQAGDVARAAIAKATGETK
jgi:hypothetical protein